MIDVKEAIAKAKKYAADVLGESDVLLEETDSDETSFDITLSFPSRTNVRAQSTFASIARNPRDREYKAFRVSKGTGEVQRMTIKQIA